MNLSNEDLMAGFAAYASVDELAASHDDENAPGTLTITTPGTPTSAISITVATSVATTVYYGC